MLFADCAGSIGVPHSEQNRSPSGISAPQDGQTFLESNLTGLPHSVQKRSPSAISAPHSVQWIDIILVNLLKVILIMIYYNLVPHIPQNFLPSAISAPQEGQVRFRSITIFVPQFPQNFLPLLIVAPQFGQSTSSLFVLLTTSLTLFFVVSKDSVALVPVSEALLNADLDALIIEEVKEEKAELFDSWLSSLFLMVSDAFVPTSATLLKADMEALLTDDIRPDAVPSVLSPLLSESDKIV